MADGIQSLSSILWGTSSAGAAVAAETTLTLGVDRQDVRVPPDLYHVWAAQLNAVKNLLLGVSATFKSGTRLGVSTQTASPFAANEQGWWVDTNGNPRFSYGGIANTLLAPALSAKGDLITYTGSAVAVLPRGTDAFVLTADSAQPNGIKWAAAGGASLGNFTFSANTEDVSSSGAVNLFTGTNATSINVGGTNTGAIACAGSQLRITQPALTGTVLSAFRVFGGAHTGMTASTEYIAANFTVNNTIQWATGNFATQRTFLVQAPTLGAVGASVITTAATVAVSGAPVAGTNMTITNSYALWLQGGNLGMAAGAKVESAGTLNHNSQVADGGAAVAHDFDTTNAFATDGDFVFRVKSNASSWFTIGRASSQRKFTFNGDSDATGSGPVTIKSTAASAGFALDATTAGGRIYSFSSSSTGVAVLADLTASSNRWQLDSSGHWSPFADNTFDLGIAGSSNRVRTLNAVRSDVLRNTSPTQNLAFSATPAINATLGNTIHIGPITANVTGPVMTSGVAGERCTIVWLKDGTAGTFTIAGWGANVRFNGTATFAAGASSIIVQEFVWDDRLGTPAWVLRSQQAVI